MFLTRMALDVNREETQQLLDHRDINTTLIYVHALERANSQAEQRIANAIFG